MGRLARGRHAGAALLAIVSLVGAAAGARAETWARTLSGELAGEARVITPLGSGAGWIVASRAAPTPGPEAGFVLTRLWMNGDVIWRELIPCGAPVEPKAIAWRNGEIFVAGNIDASGVPAPTIVRVTGGGSVYWQRAYDVGPEASVAGFAVLASGEMVVVGEVNDGSDLVLFLLRLDEDGEPLACERFRHDRTLVGADVLPTSDGGLLVLGIVGGAPWLLRSDASGARLQERIITMIGAGSFDLASRPRLVAAPDGGAFVAGSPTMGGDHFVPGAPLAIRLDPALDVSWATQLRGGVAFTGEVSGACVQADGSICLGGWYGRQRVSAGYDRVGALLARFDASGALAWQHGFETWSSVPALSALADSGTLAAGVARFGTLLLRTDAAGSIGTGCGEVLTTPFSTASVAVVAVDVADTTVTNVTASSTVLPPVDSISLGTQVVGLGEEWEPDDRCRDATPLSEGVTQSHDFCDDAEDWLSLPTCAGVGYWLIASAGGSLGGVAVDLLAPDCRTVLASTSGPSCVLDWTAAEDGEARIRVRPLDGLAGPMRPYDVTLLRTTPGCETWSNAYISIDSCYDALGLGAGIAARPDGVLVAAATDACDRDSPTLRDPVLVTIGESGETLGTRRLRMPGFGVVRDVAIAPTGSTWIAGMGIPGDSYAAWVITLGPDSGLEWARSYRPEVEPDWSLERVVALRSGGAALVGRDNGGSARGRLVVVRLDGAGDVAWSARLAGARRNRTTAAFETEAGHLVVVTGSTSDVPLVLRLDDDGRVARRAELVNAVLNQFGLDVDGAAAAGGGSYVVAGSSIVRLDEDLRTVWRRDVSLPGGSELIIKSIAGTRDGGCVVSCRTYFPLEQSLLKLDASGRTAWQRSGLYAERLVEMPDGMLAGIENPETLEIWKVESDGRMRGDCGGWATGLGVTDVPNQIYRPIDDTTLVVETTSPLDVLIDGFARSPIPLCGGSGLAPPWEVSATGAVQPLVFTSNDDLAWEDASTSGATTFAVYRGDLDRLAAGDYGSCVASGLTTNAWSDPATPPPGVVWTYLVSGRNAAGEGSLGRDSSRRERPNLMPCP